MEGLLKPGVQEAIFKKAFDYVNGKHGKVNLETCLAEMYNKNLDEDYIVCICLACISLIESGKDDFEKIEEGLSEKMKKSVMRQVGEQLSSCDDIIQQNSYGIILIIIQKVVRKHFIIVIK